MIRVVGVNSPLIPGTFWALDPKTPSWAHSASMGDPELQSVPHWNSFTWVSSYSLRPANPIYTSYPCHSKKVLATQSCPTQWPHGLQPTRLPCPWDSPAENTGVGNHPLLHGIFPTQASNPGLLHCRQILHCLSHQVTLKFPLKKQASPQFPQPSSSFFSPVYSQFTCLPTHCVSWINDTLTSMHESFTPPIFANSFIRFYKITCQSHFGFTVLIPIPLHGLFPWLTAPSPHLFDLTCSGYLFRGDLETSTASVPPICLSPCDNLSQSSSCLQSGATWRWGSTLFIYLWITSS